VRWDFGYCGHYWPIVLAPDDRRWWLWRNWWNEDWQGKPKYSDKTCPSATLSTTNPTWLDPGLNPGRRGGKLELWRVPWTHRSFLTEDCLLKAWRVFRDVLGELCNTFCVILTFSTKRIDRNCGYNRFKDVWKRRPVTYVLMHTCYCRRCSSDFLITFLTILFLYVKDHKENRLSFISTRPWYLLPPLCKRCVI
jgi:hypothetical protein